MCCRAGAGAGRRRCRWRCDDDRRQRGADADGAGGPSRAADRGGVDGARAHGHERRAEGGGGARGQRRLRARGLHRGGVRGREHLHADGPACRSLHRGGSDHRSGDAGPAAAENSGKANKIDLTEREQCLEKESSDRS